MTDWAIRREVLRETRERIAALDPHSEVLELIDQVEARWQREGKLDGDARYPDVRYPDLED